MTKESVAAEVAKLEADIKRRQLEASTERELDRLKQSINLRERSVSRLEHRVKESKITPTFNHLEHTDKSRKHIAFVFVYGYIVLVTLIIVGVPIFNTAVLGQRDALELQNILAQAGALIGSPLGFVVGYYFKEDSRH